MGSSFVGGPPSAETSNATRTSHGAAAEPASAASVISSDADDRSETPPRDVASSRSYSTSSSAARARTRAATRESSASATGRATGSASAAPKNPSPVNRTVDSGASSSPLEPSPPPTTAMLAGDRATTVGSEKKENRRPPDPASGTASPPPPSRATHTATSAVHGRFARGAKQTSVSAFTSSPSSTARAVVACREPSTRMRKELGREVAEAPRETGRESLRIRLSSPPCASTARAASANPEKL